jgi:LmbE family N-acetylglucosaminyl deacetylase
MGGSIYANRSAPNLIVLVTRGGKSKARERINAMLDAPLDESRFMAAREREFLAAVRELGISRRDVVVLDLPDGDVRSHEVRDIVRTMEQRQPGATHRTMSDVDPHSDHRAIGAAVRSAYVAGEISHCVFHLPFPLNSDFGLGLTVKLHPDMADAKRRALLQYTRWDPKNGWYAIGDQSVRSLIREQHRQPEERIHFPSGDLTCQSYSRLVDLVRRIRAKVRLRRDCDSLC